MQARPSERPHAEPPSPDEVLIASSRRLENQHACWLAAIDSLDGDVAGESADWERIRPLIRACRAELGVLTHLTPHTEAGARAKLEAIELLAESAAEDSTVCAARVRALGEMMSFRAPKESLWSRGSILLVLGNLWSFVRLRPRNHRVRSQR